MQGFEREACFSVVLIKTVSDVPFLSTALALVDISDEVSLIISFFVVARSRKASAAAKEGVHMRFEFALNPSALPRLSINNNRQFRLMMLVVAGIGIWRIGTVGWRGPGHSRRPCWGSWHKVRIGADIGTIFFSVGPPLFLYRSCGSGCGREVRIRNVGRGGRRLGIFGKAVVWRVGGFFGRLHIVVGSLDRRGKVGSNIGKGGGC